MYSDSERRRALRLAAEAPTLAEATRLSGVSRNTLKRWRADPHPFKGDCPTCDGTELSPSPYSALLGFYLGDGHIARMARYYALRISCDDAYPCVMADVEACVRAVHPRRPVFRVRSTGCTVVVSHWQHWPCLFPQHGPGRKHERPIALEGWQRAAVEAHPADFLRGLFHSDGCRANNWTQKLVAGDLKRYHYPRWQFVNASPDIRELCCWALDLAGIPWRQSNPRVISVSTRLGVAQLDELIGPKS